MKKEQGENPLRFIDPEALLETPRLLLEPLEVSHAQTLHEHCFRTLHLPHLQLDELRTRLRCTTQVLWLWLAIDPCTKILPVLSLGPRTQYRAHLLIHSLRQILAAFLPAAFHQ
jgi:hypothetical protein